MMAISSMTPPFLDSELSDSRLFAQPWQRQPISLFFWMFGFDQLPLLHQAGNGPRGQVFLPPEQFVQITFLRRTNRLEIELREFCARLTFTDRPRSFRQVRVMARHDLVDE